MQFHVNDMMCNHCVMRITRAISAVDPNANVNCNVSSKTVIVDSSLDESVVMQAIKDAGYTPERM